MDIRENLYLRTHVWREPPEPASWLAGIIREAGLCFPPCQMHTRDRPVAILAQVQSSHLASCIRRRSYTEVCCSLIAPYVSSHGRKMYTELCTCYDYINRSLPAGYMNQLCLVCQQWHSHPMARHIRARSGRGHDHGPLRLPRQRG